MVSVDHLCNIHNKIIYFKKYIYNEPRYYELTIQLIYQIIKNIIYNLCSKSLETCFIKIMNLTLVFLNVFTCIIKCIPKPYIKYWIQILC